MGEHAQSAQMRWDELQKGLKQQPDDIALLNEAVEPRFFLSHVDKDVSFYLSLASYAHKILNADPKHDVRKSLPYFYYHAGQYEAAFKHFQSLDLLTPVVCTCEDAFDAYDLIETLTRMGEYQEALKVAHIIRDAGNGSEGFNLFDWCRNGNAGSTAWDALEVLSRHIPDFNYIDFVLRRDILGEPLAPPVP